MENNDFYNYLVDKYGDSKVEVLSTGDYKVNIKNDCYYFSADCGIDDVNVQTYYPGRDGGGGSACKSILESNPLPSNSVAIVSLREADVNNTLETFDTIVEDYGLNVTKVQTSCFSASGGLGIKRLNEYLSKHPELSDSASVVVYDGWCFKNINNGTWDTSLLKDSNVPVYMVVDSAKGDFNRVKSETLDLENSGLNTYFVVMDGDISHSNVSKFAIKDGFGWYASGVTNQLGDTANYSVYKLSSDGMELVDINEVVNYNSLFVDLEIDDIFNMDSVIINEDKFDKYNYLKSLNTFDVSNLSSSTISSDSNYVMSFSNSILTSIKSDSLLDATTLDIPQGCGPLADSINKCLILYSDAVGLLLTNLAKEVDFVVSVNNSLYNLDMNLKNDINDNFTSFNSINVDNSVVGVDNNSSVVMPLSDNSTLNSVNDNEDKSNYNLTSNSVDNTDVKSSDNLTSNSTVNSFSGSAATSRGNSNSVNLDGNKNKGNSTFISAGNTKVQSNYNLNQDILTGANLIRDNVVGNRRELLFDKGDYNISLEMVNNEIVSMKAIYVFDSYESAYSYYNLLLSSNENDIISNIILNDNGFEIIFSDNFFANININK